MWTPKIELVRARMNPQGQNVKEREKKKEMDWKKKERKNQRKKKGKQEIMSGNFGKDRGSLVEWGRVSRRGRNPNYTRERAEKEQNKERKKK